MARRKKEPKSVHRSNIALMILIKSLSFRFGPQMKFLQMTVVDKNATRKPSGRR